MAEPVREHVRPSTLGGVDVLADLLGGPRGRDPFLFRMVMRPPWAVRIQDRAPVGLIAVLSGTATVVPEHPGDGGAARGRRDGEPVHLAAGTVAILKGPDAFTVADHPGTAPQIVVHPGPRVTTATGDDPGTALDLGVRTWGNDPDGSTVALMGCYPFRGEVSGRLLDALPPLVVLTPQMWASPLLGLLDAEIAKDDPGQQAVLERLFDLLLITAVRAWFARPEASPPVWYRAHADPVAGAALRALHADPARPWTVAELARVAGVSRGLFARRFTEQVGEPPMAYLTGWRLALAADLLLEPDATLGSVARRVGYGDGFALSTAFKRVRGISPAEHRSRG